MPDRKILGPSLAGFVWPAGALPSFGWWVFDCDRMPRGDLLDVVSQARPTIQAHLLPVGLARRKALGWPARLQVKRVQIINRAREALAEGGLEGADLLLRSMDLAVPGLGLGLSWAHQGVDAIVRDRVEQAAVQAEVRLGGEAGVEKESAAAELAEMIAAVAHPEVPGMVVVEDLHLMGPDLAQFLTRVAQRRDGQPVLVLGTAWPEGHNNPVYDRWRRSTDIGGNLELVAMPDLRPADLVQIVRRHAPITDDPTAARVVARYPNPLALQLFLNLRDTQDQISETGGCLHCSAEELLALPYTIRELYELRWAELPEAVRTALTYTAGTLPAGNYTWSYTPEVVTGAVLRADLSEDATGIRSALSAAVAPLGWTVGDDVTGHRFRESILGEIASAPDHLSKSQRARLQTATHDVLEEVIDEHRGTSYFIEPGTEQFHAASWLTELTPAGPLHSQAEAVAAITVARALASAHKPAAAAAILQEREWAAPLDADHPNTLTVRGNLASWLGQAGRVDDAVATLEQLLSDRLRVLGPDHPHTLTTRSHLAFWLRVVGRVDEATASSEQLLNDRLRVLGPDHPDTLITRGAVAACHGESGRLETAIAEQQQLLPDLLRVLGPDHPDTLTSRSNLATLYAEAGRLDDADAEFQRTIADRERILGFQHPDTLGTRSRLASCLRAAGRRDDAVAQFQQLLTDQLRVLGPDHPDTLISRSHLAACHGDAGRVQDAIAAFQQLLPDQLRVLSPDHPDTFVTRNNLATYLHAAGRFDAAGAEFQQLLSDRLRVLGADHPATLLTRNNLAMCQSDAGRFDAAIRELQLLLTDQLRVLGYDHPATFVTRNNLAGCWGEIGQVDRAITELQELLADELRVLGPDHLTTLAARSNLAYWLIDAERFDAAGAQLQQLLIDRVRVLGPHNPDTYRTRMNLATCRGEAGQVNRALDEFQQLLTDQLRVLGPDHPQTFTTRNNLAVCRGRTGQVDAAIAEFQQLLTDQLRVLGHDHPDTVLTRRNLTNLLRES